ncbi:MAG: hypothetical protein V4629_07290, partial [Pseudomonadota bacterium]
FSSKEEKVMFGELYSKYSELFLIIVFGDWVVWIPKRASLATQLTLFLKVLDVEHVSLNVLLSHFFYSLFKNYNNRSKDIQIRYKKLINMFGMNFIKSQEFKEYSLIIGRLLKINRKDYQQAVMSLVSWESLVGIIENIDDGLND